MATVLADKSINWQVPSADDSEISVADYRAMVSKAENSVYMSYETHRQKFNEWIKVPLRTNNGISPRIINRIMQATTFFPLHCLLDNQIADINDVS